MEAETFKTSLQTFSRRVPFEPFVVELVTGEQVLIDHPEALITRGRTAVYIAPTGRVTLFDHQGVLQLMEGAEAQPSNGAADR